MGGQIKVKSTVGKGTRFIITLSIKAIDMIINTENACDIETLKELYL